MNFCISQKKEIFFEDSKNDIMRLMIPFRKNRFDSGYCIYAVSDMGRNYSGKPGWLVVLFYSLIIFCL